MLDDALVAGLDGGFAGELIGPDHPGYERARRVWNGTVDRRPALIARCAGAEDVVSALGFARERGRAVAVRGGVLVRSERATPRLGDARSDGRKQKCAPGPDAWNAMSAPSHAGLLLAGKAGARRTAAFWPGFARVSPPGAHVEPAIE